MKFHWFLPTNGGDGRHVVSGGHGVVARLQRPARQRALPGTDRPQRRAARLRGRAHPDRRLVRGRLADHRDARPAVGAAEVPRRVPPGLTSPTLAAQMAATFQNLSGGRLLLNVVTGGESHEQRAVRRLPRQGRPLRALRRVPRSRPPAVARRDGHLRRSSTCGWSRRGSQQLPDPVPEIYFGGSSPAAGDVAAKHADVYLTWGEPPAAVATKIAWIRELAEKQGREIRFGIRMHTINRDTAEEAWAEADRLLAGIDDAEIAPRPGGPEALRVRRAAQHARPQQRLARRPRDPPQRLGRRRPGPRRRRHRARRQPRGGRRPHRGVRRTRHRRVRPLRLPAPRGRLPLRRGGPAGAGEAGAVDQPGPGRAPARRCPSAPSGRPRERPRRRRRRQPQAALAHVRRRPVRRPTGGRAPTSSSTSPTTAAELFDWRLRDVADLVEEVAGSLVVVVASPTYKATYTGLLKAFLDRFPAPRARRRHRRPADARRLPGARPRPRARAASAAGRARCVGAHRAASTSSTPSTTDPSRTTPGSPPASSSCRRSPTPTRTTGGVRMTLHAHAPPKPAGLDQRTLRDAFGAFPSGVVAVAASVKGQLTGIAASSFTSVSIDPPLVSFSISTTSSTWPLLREAGRLGISVLADHHDAVCRQLAGPARGTLRRAALPGHRERRRAARRGRRDLRLLGPRGGRRRRPRHRAARGARGRRRRRRAPARLPPLAPSPSCTATTSTRPASTAGSTAPRSTAGADRPLRPTTRRTPHERARTPRQRPRLAAPRRPRLGRRRHHRVVRLLPLRHGRAVVFDKLYFNGLDGPAAQFAAFAHLRGRLLRPTRRRAGLRPLRRPDRPQADAAADAGDHGRRHRPDRPAADVRPDRRLGADRAGRAAGAAGHRRRRRVRRRRAARRRVRPGRAPRLLRQLRPHRRPRRARPGRAGPSRSPGCCPRRSSSPGAGARASSSASCCSASAPTSGCR